MVNKILFGCNQIPRHPPDFGPGELGPTDQHPVTVRGEGAGNHRHYILVDDHALITNKIKLLQKKKTFFFNIPTKETNIFSPINRRVSAY